jgi:uncharacterized protein (DUF433 family)
MPFHHSPGPCSFAFADLRTLMARGGGDGPSRRAFVGFSERGSCSERLAATNTLPLPSGKLYFCMEPLMKSPRVISDPEILGGTPVFIGTRVPVRILFEHLEAGDSLEVFLEDFPSVSRELAIQVLEDAKMALVLGAHTA